MTDRACLVCGFGLAGWPGGARLCSELCRIEHSRARDRARQPARREEKRRYRAKHREKILETDRVRYRDYYPERKAQIQARRRARRLEIAAALQEFNSFVGANHKPARAKPVPARVPSKEEAAAQSRLRNREKINARKRQWRKAHPDRRREEKRIEYGKYQPQIRARSRVLELEKSALVHAFRELELI